MTGTIALVIIGFFLIYGIYKQRQEIRKEQKAMQDDIPADTELVKVLFKKRTIYMTAGQLSEWSSLTTKERQYFLKNLQRKFIKKV